MLSTSRRTFSNTHSCTAAAVHDVYIALPSALLIFCPPHSYRRLCVARRTLLRSIRN
ncbi:hypothetical protein HBI56_196300 [Parastagonospora nodorum]|uniref:Uncharacterized protein n=1 Tax=Phaeosphaeria nodorum (strain SN15 / ATCC MYA-4574 / FGSC 10173) TaxID=321614 RepID=A0A7U2F6G2_PHANO|nr:hypothetical protein HBH56_208240 [Parastagonospora nodorum]QRC99608.1 hypothetical protein JI435_413640 [Parastagonospora nodorum SN15]KAH3923546.1 hypothetical protein HBH54_207110 [Parastagonospora nodorum]KAH3960359.1 hypothetical protein HBH51_191630 [Parastagonospora nodorum]KAH3965171.1 hypothetical protein HBH52_206500 [Parastagonospora nodorum]